MPLRDEKEVNMITFKSDSDFEELIERITQLERRVGCPRSTMTEYKRDHGYITRVIETLPSGIFYRVEKIENEVFNKKSRGKK